MKTKISALKILATDSPMQQGKSFQTELGEGKLDLEADSVRFPPGIPSAA